MKQPSGTIHHALRGALTVGLLVGVPLVGCTDLAGETVNPYSTESHPWASTGPLLKNDFKRGGNALSDLTIVSASNGWGPIERDSSNGNEISGDGKAITINGKVYPKGLGVHAPSEMRFDLKGQCMNFSSDIGLDDEIKTQSRYGSVIFKVFVDDKEVFNSGVMNAGQVKPVDLKLEGAQSLRLVVENGGEDNWYDRADWANATLGCMIASAGSSPGFAVTDAASKGAFSPLVPNWPTIAVHSALLPTGNVMTWFTTDTTGDNRDDVSKPHNSTLAWIWNPTSNTFTPADNKNNDLFCAGAASNFEGKLIVSGGNLGGRFGPREINTFDSGTNQWTKTGTMLEGRWYPTVTALPNKEMLLIGGNSGTSDGTKPIPNTIPEVIQTNGTIRQLSYASTTDGGPGWGSKEDEHYYPWMHVAPDGKVFNSGPHSRMMTLDTAGAGGWSNPTERGDNFYRKYGTSVMYDVGKILVLGGGPSICPANQSCGTSSARLINLNVNSQAREVSSMGNKRVHANATVLPDGRVIVIGGNRNGNTDDNSFDDSQSIYESELWSPVTETFTPAAVMKTPRNYHSSALLLPDGRVLSAGGGGCNTGCPQNHADAEIYYPPYLFNGSGRLVERPVISQLPTSIAYNTGFEVSSSDAAIISSAVLMRLGAATHAFDQGQMRVPLSIKRRLGATLSLTAPNTANIAPPGMYMLFIIDAAGVPSVAKILRLQ